MHRKQVMGLLLRGVFLLKESEIHWFYQNGASNIFPDAFDRYVSPIPENERDDLLNAFYKRLTGKNASARAEAAEPKARLLLTLSDQFEPWRRRHARLARELRLQPYLLQFPKAS